MKHHNPLAEPTMADIMLGSPQLTSYGSGWKDINIESYCLPPGKNEPQEIPHHSVNINIGSTYTYESRLNDRYDRGKFMAGNISLYPAMQPMPYRSLGNVSIISISLSDELLVRNAKELLNCDRVELQVNHNTQDPLLKHIALALKANLEAGSMGGAVYAQTMANAIAVHLLQNYSTKRNDLPCVNGGLAPQKLKRVIRYIDEHLAEKIVLKDLAAIAQLSQHHFARAFKQSMGSSPHQYIIQTRIALAQRLLKSKSVSIKEVAIACGFSSQSHLHRHFKKYVGVTPKQFCGDRQYFDLARQDKYSLTKLTNVSLGSAN